MENEQHHHKSKQVGYASLATAAMVSAMGAAPLVLGKELEDNERTEQVIKVGDSGVKKARADIDETEAVSGMIIPIDLGTNLPIEGYEQLFSGESGEDITSLLPVIPGYQLLNSDEKINIPGRDGNIFIDYTKTSVNIIVKPVDIDGNYFDSATELFIDGNYALHPFILSGSLGLGAYDAQNSVLSLDGYLAAVTDRIKITFPNPTTAYNLFSSYGFSVSLYVNTPEGVQTYIADRKIYVRKISEFTYEINPIYVKPGEAEGGNTGGGDQGGGGGGGGGGTGGGNTAPSDNVANTGDDTATNGDDTPPDDTTPNSDDQTPTDDTTTPPDDNGQQNNNDQPTNNTDDPIDSGNSTTTNTTTTTNNSNQPTDNPTGANTTTPTDTNQPNNATQPQNNDNGKLPVDPDLPKTGGSKTGGSKTPTTVNKNQVNIHTNTQRPTTPVANASERPSKLVQTGFTAQRNSYLIAIGVVLGLLGILGLSVRKRRHSK